VTSAQLIRTLIVLLGIGPQLFGAEFWARVVDNLGNPVDGARIVANCDELRPDGSYRRTRELFTLDSDLNGVLRGTYKQPKGGCEKSVHLRVAKEGYGASQYDSFRPIYMLRRKVRADELRRIVQLSGADMKIALRNMLTSDVDGPFQELVFYYEDRLRPVLRSLAEDPEAGIPARSLLAFIGVPEDLRLIAQLGSPKDQDPGFPNRWLYGVNCSLLEPTSEIEWTFLRESALGEHKDLWAVRGAIQSLKLIASPRSLEILEEVQRDSSFGAQLAPNAIAYIQSRPQPLRGQQLEDLGHRVAQVLGSRTWTGNRGPEYNQAGDKALIRFDFDTGEDVYVFTGTFQRVDDTWVLRGVRESMQGLKLSAIPPKSRKTK
jgi:hypothetical protein